MDYGFSFYIHAINEHELIRNRNMKEIAMAVRMANHGDKKEWRKFLKRK